jgi:hypothetical protein
VRAVVVVSFWVHYGCPLAGRVLVRESLGSRVNRHNQQNRFSLFEPALCAKASKAKSKPRAAPTALNRRGLLLVVFVQRQRRGHGGPWV